MKEGPPWKEEWKGGIKGIEGNSEGRKRREDSQLLTAYPDPPVDWAAIEEGLSGLQLILKVKKG